MVLIRIALVVALFVPGYATGCLETQEAPGTPGPAPAGTGPSERVPLPVEPVDGPVELRVAVDGFRGTAWIAGIA